MTRASNRGKFLISIFCGVVVGSFAAGAHWFVVAHDRALIARLFMGDFIGALIAVIVCLAIQLRQEDAHFHRAMSGVSIVTELNHHLRSAVFRLCLAVQKIGDKETSQLASQAVEQINTALRDATADVISGRVQNMHENADRKS